MTTTNRNVQLNKNKQDKYILDIGWLLLLHDLNLSPKDVLQKSKLPLGLANEKTLVLTIEEYYRLWDTIITMSDDDCFILNVINNISPDMFSPAIYAALCSPNLSIALSRLQQYKPIIGPMCLDISQDKQHHTAVSLSGLPLEKPLTLTLSLFELLFIVHLARLGTRESIKPIKVELAHDVTGISNITPYEDYFGVSISSGKANRIIFDESTMQLPFLTNNDAIWKILQPDLSKRIAEYAKSCTFKLQLRSYLLDVVASGQITITHVAKEFAMSSRTLQRKLKEEETNFQNELSWVRENLAYSYLNNTELSSAEISFLLGYNDKSSFFRAFSQWTGKTPDTYRRLKIDNTSKLIH